MILSSADEFYSLFYLGLFCESCRLNNPAVIEAELSKAKNYMKQAIQTNYYTTSLLSSRSDYMTSVARVRFILILMFIYTCIIVDGYLAVQLETSVRLLFVSRFCK